MLVTRYGGRSVHCTAILLRFRPRLYSRAFLSLLLGQSAQGGPNGCQRCQSQKSRPARPEIYPSTTRNARLAPRPLGHLGVLGSRRRVSLGCAGWPGLRLTARMRCMPSQLRSGHMHRRQTKSQSWKTQPRHGCGKLNGFVPFCKLATGMNPTHASTAPAGRRRQASFRQSGCPECTRFVQVAMFICSGGLSKTGRVGHLLHRRRRLIRQSFAKQLHRTSPGTRLPVSA